MSVFDRLSEAVPRTGRAWIEAVVILAVLVVVIFVVLPRFVRRRVLRWVAAVALLAVAGWLTVFPVFFDKRVDEPLLTVGSGRSPPVSAPAVSAPHAVPPTTAVPPVRISTGPIHGLAGHFGRGSAAVYRLADSSVFVRLEDIETPHAPAVYVYLVPRADQTGPGGGVDLGALKGNVGSQNYVVPAGVDVSKYKAVLLWCRRFSTPVAAAPQSAV